MRSLVFGFFIRRLIFLIIFKTMDYVYWAVCCGCFGFLLFGLCAGEAGGVLMSGSGEPLHFGHFLNLYYYE